MKITRNKKLKLLSLLSVSGFIFLIYFNLLAFDDGIVGFTKKNGNTTGCVCHQFEPNDTVSVVISGPSTVRAGDTAIYTLRLKHGPAVAGGCDISTSRGQVYPSLLDTSLRREEPFTGAGFELTHKRPKMFTGDSLKFTFQYIAPLTPNVTDTLFANGNSVNHDTTSDHDMWNYANNFIINIVPTSGINNYSGKVSSFELNQNYPNPFNPETKISFNIKKSSYISLSVFDESGRLVADLISNKYYVSGEYSLSFNSNQYNLSSGVYFYRLNSADKTGEKYTDVRKMMLVK